MFHKPRLAHRALAVAIAASVAGCGYHAGGVRTATLGQEVPVTEAFMTPPPGGPEVVTVLEQRYENALAQDIILENNSSVAGQNVLYVRAFGPMGRDAGRGRIDPDVPSLRTIRREMAERFPGVHMEVSGLYAQNRYGPFSYATGRTKGGTNCVYAWQRIAAEPKVFRFNTGSITWRLRICDPRSSARDLLLLAYGLTINGYFLSERWNPYGDPPPLDPRIGTPGETILPEQPVDPTVIAPRSFGGEPRLTVSRPARRAAPAQPAPSGRPFPNEPLNEALPGAAVVPRPQATDLNEPVVERSNLPQRAPRPVQRIEVPRPTAPASVPPRPQASVPLPPSGARVVLPQGESPASPSVRVVRLSDG